MRHGNPPQCQDTLAPRGQHARAPVSLRPGLHAMPPPASRNREGREAHAISRVCMPDRVAYCCGWGAAVAFLVHLAPWAMACLAVACVRLGIPAGRFGGGDRCAARVSRRSYSRATPPHNARCATDGTSIGRHSERQSGPVTLTGDHVRLVA